MLTLSNTHLSLQVGVWRHLTADQPVTWSSDNANVFVNQQGWVMAIADATWPASVATITATAGGETATCKVTVVNWPAHGLTLEPVGFLPLCTGLVKDGNFVLAVGTDKKMFRTTDMQTLEEISTTPECPGRTPILKTPAGYFIKSENGMVFRSTDLAAWSAEHSAGPGLNNAFDYYHDGTSGTTYIYAGEYVSDPMVRTQVRRGTYPAAGQPVWQQVLNFFATPEHVANPALTPFCRHIHTTQVDRATGHVYVGTGDSDAESAIWLSKDHGASWRVLGTGSQDWRTLSMWFTADYIYWNMDSPQTQRIWRLARTNLDAQSVGNDLKELVCTLDSGSHWYITWARDPDGDDIVVMGAAVEGAIRDRRARVYYLKEQPGGLVEYGELYALAWSDDSTVQTFMQLEPYVQDDAGFVYFRARDTAAHDNVIWKMRFSRKGAPAPPPPFPPGIPQNLRVTVNGPSVVINWDPPATGGMPSAYQLEAGTAPGLANTAVLTVMSTTLSVASVPNGTYFVRVRATNGAGNSPASGEVSFTIGPATVPPGPPSNLTASAVGHTVTLSWSPPTTGGAPSSYTVQAGSAPGLSDIGSVAVGATTMINVPAVPSGTYHVRVIATNSVGGSAPSNEVAVVVP